MHKTVPPRWRRLLFRGGLAILLLAAGLILLELSLRVYQAWRPVWFLPGHDRLLASHGRPGERNYDDRLNSRGYNDGEFRPDTPRRHRRLVGIADSFGFGVVPRRHNVLTLLEQRLSAAGTEVEVCNISVPDIGPAQYLQQLRDEALPLRPDLVVCMFYIGNDFTDALPPADPAVLYPRRLARLAAGVWRNDRAAVQEYREASYVLALVDYLRVARTASSGPDIYSDSEPTFTPARYREIRRAESAIFRADGELLPRLAAEQAVRFGTMREAAELAGGAGFLVVLAPQELQVMPELQRELHGDTTGYDYARPNRVLGELLRERGIACLDLLPAFAAAAGRQPLYKPRDTHWNIAGNALAAEQIAAWLAVHGADAYPRQSPAAAK